MANTVKTRIIAKDEASAVFNNLEGAISRGATAGVLFGNAITGALNVATSAVSGFVGKLGEAVSIQQENISVSGNFMKVAGFSFNEATQFVDNFSQAMSQVASDLPGQTSDYVNLGKGISDNLVGAFKDLNGELDRDTFSEYLESISRDAGFLATTADVSAKQAAQGISKLLSGRSMAELAQLEFFEANPAVLSTMEKEAEKLGKNLKDMTKRERAEVLRAALAVPQEVIEASTQSISGLVEGFKSTLFDPQTGMFGLMRDLSKQDGNQSVLSELNEGLSTLLGEDGVLARVGSILNDAGITIDPMMALFNWLEGFNGWLSNIQEGLNGKSLIPTNLGEVLGEFYNRAISAVGSIDFKGLSDRAGRAIGFLINEFADYLQTIDLGQVVRVVGQVMLGVINGLGVALQTLDWGSVTQVALKVIGVFILGSFVTAIIGAIGGIPIAIGLAVAALISIIVNNWAELRAYWIGKWQEVVGAITGFFSGVRERIAGAFDQVKSAISSAVQRVRSSVLSIFDRIEAGVRGIIPDFIERRTVGMPNRADGYIPNAAGGFNIGGLLSAAIREGRSMPNNSELVMANSSEAILNRTQQFALARSLANRGGLQIGNITILQTQATDARGIAQDVMREIASQWERYQQAQLSPQY